MTATYIFDVFATLDGFGSYNGSGDWGGYWGKQGPDSRRPAQYSRGAAAGPWGHHLPEPVPRRKRRWRPLRQRRRASREGVRRVASDALRSRPLCRRPTDTRSVP